MNIIGKDMLGNCELLNRYHLACLSFREIVYEEYFLQILCLRLSTAMVIGIGSKIISKKIVIYGFTVLMSVMLGSIITMMIFTNGIWGIWFLGCALVPHILFYVVAFSLWKTQSMKYAINNIEKVGGLKIIAILLLIVVGCICEAFISPVIVESVIKY